jgi:hypothetical protein
MRHPATTWQRSAILVLGVTLLPATAVARISLALDVDGSLGQATAVVVARVTSVKTAGTATYQGQRVIGLDVPEKKNRNTGRGAGDPVQVRRAVR